MLLEGLDGGDGVARLEAFVVLLHFPADDGFCGGSFAAAIGEVGGSDLLEVVDVVDEAAFDLVHAGVDVAGDGDIDEEHGPVSAALQEVLAVRAAEDFLRGTGGGDDDVGAGGLFVECVEGDGFGIDNRAGEVGGDDFGAGLGAVGHEDGGGSVLDEVAGGEFGHLACAYEEDGFFLEGSEDFSREIDGYRGDGDRARADLGFAADFFGDGEGALEKRFEVSGDGAHFAGYGVRLFDLAEDLGLAYDHAVEGAGDAEEVADGFALAEFVEVRLDVAGGYGEVFVEEAEEVGFGCGLNG